MARAKIYEYLERLGIEPEYKIEEPLDVLAGKAGYEQYLADIQSGNDSTGEKAPFLQQALRVTSALSQGIGKLVREFDSFEDFKSYVTAPGEKEFKRPKDDWTTEEQWRFGQLYSQDKNKAYEYAKQVNDNHAYETKQKDLDSISNWAAKNPINATVGSVGALASNIFLGGLGYLDSLGQKLKYGETYENEHAMPHELANALQGGVSSKLNDWGTINEKVPIVGGKGLGDLYNIGMSVGQLASLASLDAGDAATLASYFGMSASNGYTDAKGRGATDEQAFGVGIASGLAEAVPEMFNLKRLTSLASGEAVENVFKTVLKMAGAEAGEEATTSVLTELSDRWIMGGKSNYQILVNNLMAQGMSEAEAEKAAFKYTINNIAYDAFAGGISGTVSGAGAIGANKFYQKYLNDEANTKAKETLTPQISSIIEEGKKYETTKKKAESIAKKVEAGEEPTGYELRTFASKVAEATNNSEVNAVRQAIVQQMQEGGLSESKAKILGEIALNKTLGNDVSKLQDLLLKNNEVATQVYNQTTEQVIDSGVGDSDWIASTPLAKIREERKKLNEKRVSQQGEKDKEKLDQIKEELAAVYGKNTKEYKINMASVEGKFEQTGDKVTYTKKSADSKIHTEGITSSLTHKDISELAAIEELANALGIDIYVYETKLDGKTGERIYVDSNGNRYSDSGFYDPNNNTVHIDLHAGQNGEGTMRYTASHEVVHFVKENAAEHFDALEKLVTKALVEGGYSMEKLIEAQRKKAEENGQTLTEEQLREEVVAEACQSFLASKNAAAEIRALKSENRGLWDVLKRFFISLFNKLSTIYKGVDPDSVEGKYIADMRKAVKPIRDAFMEGAAQASKNVEAKKKASANTTTEAQTTFEKNYQKSKDVRKNARYVNEHRATLEKLGDESTTVPINELLKRYDKLVEIWDNLGGELSSEFLDQWNNKQGKDRAFTVFKAQAGYKYNVELSSMCKKGIPLFEAIDTIVRSEVVDQLKSKTIAKAEKEILYELLKEKSFDIPCAICYVEQARQREGEIINSFLDGKVEKTPAGKTKTYKIGWNETFKALEKEMKSQGVNYTFPEVGRDIATDKYTKAELPAMDAKTEKAFYNSLLKLINKEIARYNSEKDPKAKPRLTLSSVTPSEIKRCLGGTLSANLKLYKTIATNPDSRFRINNDLLYSSATTTNLASFHNDLYSLFNMQGGVSGYKLKQGTVVYWGDILSKKWDSSKLRKEGGVRNQSNSDFMMYTLLDQAQMYIDFTAKGYYLQAYTKVISELKLFGLSKGKINASLIPRVEIYRKDNGFEVDIEKTRDNAGLDKNGNPIYDDIEGIPHEEAFMLIEDADYSKNIGGICIGYSDKHISKLLDDARIQLIIGYHDKTDDPDKRYYGARYAKNYNGENEARVKNADGTFTTKHVGFNQFVIAAEKLFKKGVDSVDYNGNTYKYDDIPKLAADMYLKMCQDKNYIPAYDQFSSHENYYKLLADFSLYDSEGHYAPHQKVAYNMPDVVPYLDENGNKEYMPTKDYIKKELKKELTVRDDISAALSDHTENGIIPKFVKQANQLYESQNIRHKARDSSGNELTLQQQEYFKDSAVRDKKGNLLVLYHGTTADFNTFKKGDVGFHFGTKGAARGRVGYGSNVNLKEVYLNITNPIVFDEDLGSWDADFRLTRELYERGILTWEEAETVLLTDNKQYRRTTEAANKKLVSVLQSKGYDGISYTNTFESKTPTTSYIIFDSNQAKLTTNTEPTLDKDIRHKARGVNKYGIEVFEISEEIKKLPIKERQKAFLDIMKNEYRGRTAKFTRNGHFYYAAFEPKDMSKNIYGDNLSDKKGWKAKINIGAEGDIFELVENAKYDGSKAEVGKPSKAHKNITYWDYFIKTVQIDNTVFDLVANVRKKDDGQFVYSIQLNENKKIEASPSLGSPNGVLNRMLNASDSRISQSTENVNTQTENSSKNIRHKARTTVTSESAPYVSPTASSIVMDIDSGYTYKKTDKAVTTMLQGQIMFTNAQAGIEHYGKKYGVKNIEALVQAARTSKNQAEEMIAGNQFRIGSDTKVYQGEGLEKIARPVFEMPEAKQRAFYDYLFHYHNADRMSLERRSIEWNEENRKKYAEYAKSKMALTLEGNKLTNERSKLTRKKEDVPRKQKINIRLSEIKAELKVLKKKSSALQKEIDSFEALKNKPVLGLNKEVVEEKKKNLSEQISELRKQRAQLSHRKNTAEEMLKLTEQIEQLVKERNNISAEVTEEQSKEAIQKYEETYGEEFKEIAEKLWKYSENLSQFRVDTGLIDQDTFDYLKKLYPHYVPTYRADNKTGIAAVKGKNNLAVNQSIKSAKGSTKDLLNPIVIMARQTMETVRAGRVNQIVSALYEGAKGDKTYIAEISKKKVNKSEAVDIDPMELRPKDNQVTFFKNGEKITLQVSSEIFAGFNAFTPDATPNNPIKRIAAGAMNIFKKMVTSWNPAFLARNAVRDIQDAGINSKYGLEFVKAYKIIKSEIENEGEYWKLYKAMGGVNETYFDFDEGFTKHQTKRGFGIGNIDPNSGVVRKSFDGSKIIMQRMENLNNLVETLPRFAEFIASIKSGNTAEQAMLDAADVTTNFARAGVVTKVANKYFIPFLNPSIQGASKAVRNVADVFKEGDAKQKAIAAMKLFAKATIVGIVPMVINGLLYNDDEDYEDLREADKENNFLVKVGDNFWKIPRGRMASVIGGLVNRTFFAEEWDLKGYLENVSTQMSPVESMSRTIFSPFADVKNNVTWYGSAIEGQQFENIAPSQRFDEGTSSIAIAMAQFLNNLGLETSPKKIHYLLDQYSGVIGDFVLPMTTNKAEKGFLSGNFTIDPVTSNKLSDQFYDLYYEAQYAKNADENNKIAEYQVKHLNRIKKAIGEMYEQKSDINNSNLSDAEKRSQSEAIQILINEMYKTALQDYGLITNAIKSTSSVDDEYRYAEVVRIVYGAEEALEVYNTKVYEKSVLLNEAGVPYDVFYNYYFTTRGIKSDVDKRTQTVISGSKKKKFIEAINKIDTTDVIKTLLIAISGYSIDDEGDRTKLLQYLNRLKISKEQKIELADLCGYVYKYGRITSK